MAGSRTVPRTGHLAIPMPIRAATPARAQPPTLLASMNCVRKERFIFTSPLRSPFGDQLIRCGIIPIDVNPCPDNSGNFVRLWANAIPGRLPQ